MNELKLVECPRDAMQGMANFVETNLKAEYINQLIQCGFDTIDFGSFVSPKAIPQMRDTAEVLKQLKEIEKTKLLAIIANERGAEDACSFEEISYLGYPFSVSEEFQKRNTNASIEDSIHRVEAIQNLTIKNKKKLVVYLSMGFGNPYGEAWNVDIVLKWSERLHKDFGIEILALSDTIGCATNESIDYLFSNLIPELKDVEFGAHLHCKREDAEKVVKAAYDAGCRRFDGAIKGFGGCPMATDKLTGNMPTEIMLNWFAQQGISTGINNENFINSMMVADKIFTH